MRDVFLVVFLLGSLPVALWRPFYGVCLFALVSLMNPHRLTWGFSSDMPWAMLIAIAVLLGLWFRERPLFTDSLKRYWLLILYLGWMAITTWDATAPDDASALYTQALKVHLMVFVTLMLIDTKNRLRIFMMVVVLSVAFFGIKGGLFTLLTAGQYRVWGPPGTAIGDNNHLAAALVVMFPLVYWIQQTTESKVWRNALLVCLALIAIAILGSKSRGAFIGIVVMTIFLIMKGRQRFRMMAGLGVVASLAALLMPASYWGRIDSIDEYQDDSSAQGRINTWITAYRIANARITGGGLDYYGEWLYLTHAPNPDRVHSAHSIYFQALGEQGWIGFFIYVLFLMILWVQCSRVARRKVGGNVADSDRLLAKMLQVALIGFMTAGAFVNIGNWDGIFYLAAGVYGLSRLTEQQREQVPFGIRDIGPGSVPGRVGGNKP